MTVVSVNVGRPRSVEWRGRKLRFDRDDVVKRFMDSARTGFYAGVAREGDIGASDALELVRAPEGTASIAEVVRRRQMKDAG
jgi:MOSC domain-containing protein YiiM